MVLSHPLQSSMALGHAAFLLFSCACSAFTGCDGLYKLPANRQRLSIFGNQNRCFSLEVGKGLLPQARTNKWKQPCIGLC